DWRALQIRLNRPEVRSAFDDVLIEELTRAFHAAAGEPGVRAVVLSGEGPTFCGGADVTWMRKPGSYTKDENEADAERMAQMLRAIDACPRPVIALAHGAAIGGGGGPGGARRPAAAAAGGGWCLA